MKTREGALRHRVPLLKGGVQVDRGLKGPQRGHPPPPKLPAFAYVAVIEGWVLLSLGDAHLGAREGLRWPPSDAAPEVEFREIGAAFHHVEGAEGTVETQRK